MGKNCEARRAEAREFLKYAENQDAQYRDGRYRHSVEKDLGGLRVTGVRRLSQPRGGMWIVDAVVRKEPYVVLEMEGGVSVGVRERIPVGSRVEIRAGFRSGERWEDREVWYRGRTGTVGQYLM